MASQLIALTNRWGTHFGGINAFNTGFMKALRRHEGCHGITLTCVVESATVGEKQHAENCGVRLLESGADMLSSNPATVETVARLVGVEAPPLWLGHDDKTGPLALALRKELGGKTVLFNHMAHVAYQGFKKGDSQNADAKKELGFSQDCAWEKRFSCGEQPRTELSGWCDAMTPGSALDDQ